MLSIFNRVNDILSFAIEKREQSRAVLAETRQVVRPIIEEVKRKGDQALQKFTNQYDKVSLDVMRVPGAFLQRAHRDLDPNLLGAISQATQTITQFHRKTALLADSPAVSTVPGISLSKKVTPLDSVGLYVPGGETPLLSTALMLLIPAHLAGVRRIVVVSPPNSRGQLPKEVAAICQMFEVEEVYAVGGAQAIAALAYGTESIARVDKICGPGNIYVTAAKAEVAADAYGPAIDMLAGPSEVLVYADQSANPHFVAADLLSQAEHDQNARVFLLGSCSAVLQQVINALERQVIDLPRREVARASLAQSAAVACSADEAVLLINEIAPEHLIIQTAEPERVLQHVRHAGSAFVGPWAPETIGDYCSGSNHVLPTMGYARVCSGVSVATFQKEISVTRATAEGLRNLGKTACIMARAEGLEAHARAVEIRLGGKQ